jgi:TorA maturation chaperone TorD
MNPKTDFDSGPPVSSALDEETARAEIYGLLAAFFYAPPNAEPPAPGAFLEEPWRDLVALARALPDTAIRDEYNTLFGGMGKPEVYLFGSHYLSGFLNEKPLAALRGDLARLGLARNEAMSETEDHIAYLCEVMRYLIAAEDVAVANLTSQRQFFGDHIQPWATMLCDAVAAHPKARFYAALIGFTRAFFSIESQGFDMLV